jgi:hypothetical protein
VGRVFVIYFEREENETEWSWEMRDEERKEMENGRINNCGGMMF